MADDEKKMARARAIRALAQETWVPKLRMPWSTDELAAMWLHQVWIIPALDSEGQADPIIELDLFEEEVVKDPYDLKLDGLSESFENYLQGGKAPETDGSVIKYLGPEEQPISPTMYAMRPIPLGPHGHPRVGRCVNRFDFRWSRLMQALLSPEHSLVIAPHTTPRRARYYQTRTNAKGSIELWMASLPDIPDHKPDEDGFVVIKPNRVGIAVWLTNGFLSNLLDVTTAMLPDIEALAKRYWPDT